jgi:hypothetical protein
LSRRADALEREKSLDATLLAGAGMDGEYLVYVVPRGTLVVKTLIKAHWEKAKDVKLEIDDETRRRIPFSTIRLVVTQVTPTRQCPQTPFTWHYRKPSPGHVIKCRPRSCRTTAPSSAKATPATASFRV